MEITAKNKACLSFTELVVTFTSIPLPGDKHCLEDHCLEGV